jgi:hypothetical protein
MTQNLSWLVMFQIEVHEDVTSQCRLKEQEVQNTDSNSSYDFLIFNGGNGP